MAEPIVVVDDVYMKFNLSSEKVDNLKEYFIKRLKNKILFKIAKY